MMRYISKTHEAYNFMNKLKSSVEPISRKRNFSGYIKA